METGFLLIFTFGALIGGIFGYKLAKWIYLKR